MSKKTLIIVNISLFLVLFILMIVPVFEIKLFLKENFPQLKILQGWIKEVVEIRLSFSLLQKISHLFSFAILSFFCLHLLNMRMENIKKSIAYTWAIVCLFAIFTEFIQFFFDRNPSIKDVILDLIGSGIGIWAYTLLAASFRKPPHPTERIP